MGLSPRPGPFFIIFIFDRGFHDLVEESPESGVIHPTHDRLSEADGFLMLKSIFPNYLCHHFVSAHCHISFSFDKSIIRGSVHIVKYFFHMGQGFYTLPSNHLIILVESAFARMTLRSFILANSLRKLSNSEAVISYRTIWSFSCIPYSHMVLWTLSK